MAVNLKDSLTTKLGPLPIGVWVGVPAVLYVTYRWYRHKSGGDSEGEGEVVPIGVATDIGDSADFSNGYGNAAGNYNGGSTATNTEAPDAIEDNDDWARQAQNFLIARGIDPQTAVRAIRAYIYGDSDTLNTEQMAALNLALQQFRSPPDPSGINLPTLTPGTAPNDDTPPPASEFYNPAPPVTGTFRATANAGGTYVTGTGSSLGAAVFAVGNQINANGSIPAGSYTVNVARPDGGTQTQRWFKR